MPHLVAHINSKIISVEDKTVGQLKLKKSGNMVTATFAWSPAGVVAAHVYKLETIPDGFRPNQKIYISQESLLMETITSKERFGCQFTKTEQSIWLVHYHTPLH